MKIKRLNIKNKLKTGTWRGQEGTSKQCEARGKHRVMALGPGRSPGQRLWASGSMLVRRAGCEQETLSCGLGSKTDKQGKRRTQRKQWHLLGAWDTEKEINSLETQTDTWRKQDRRDKDPQAQRPMGRATHGQSFPLRQE